jgi:formylglycine-generating enzyme required for sulfatase activity
LTHDYLIPSLREWLTRKQKETRRGRAELRLAERAAAWKASPESRNLPTWYEWLIVRLFTRKRDWTGPQRRMMRKAGRYNAVRGLAVLSLLLLLGWAAYEFHGRLRAQRAQLLVESLLAAEPGEVPRIIEQLSGYRPWAASYLEARLGERGEPNSREETQVGLARRQAKIGVALVLMGREEKVWPLLRHIPDPTVRSYLIERLGPAGVEVSVLAARLDEEQDVSARRAILLSLGQYDGGVVRLAGGGQLVARLLGLYRDDPDAGIHGAAGWVLRQSGEGEKLKEIDAELATGRAEGGRRWFVNRQGQTLVVLPPPGEVVLGEGPKRHQRRVDWGFAIAAREVTVGQFLRFRLDRDSAIRYGPRLDCPVSMVSWYAAASYCNWLSAQEGIPAEQWCYLPNEEGWYDEGMRLAPGWWRRTGYRLPTEAEWEHACRAGSVTEWSCGRADELLLKYAWFGGNSWGSHPVGVLKPNDAGLFDMHGNALEWCQGREGIIDDEKCEEYIKESIGRVLRGGSFSNRAEYVRSADRLGARPTLRDDSVGFRPARTFR